MIGLKQLLLSLLMTCMVGYSSAWAFESCAVEVEDHDFVISQINEQAADQQSVDSDICNHLCHAFAHMVAICEQSGYTPSAIKSPEFSGHPQNFVSLITTPDNRPPIV